MGRENVSHELGLVTVIICVYNAGRFLRPAVDSILSQTYRALQVIVVDDGSTDGCVSDVVSLRDERLMVIGQENRGKPAALNLGLSHARGEFYAVHDADDLSHPQRIERQVQAMRDYPDVAAVFCGYDLILNGRHIAPRFAGKDSALCRRDIERLHMPGHDPTVMYRSAMVEGILYDENLPIVEGYDHIMRVGERFPMFVVGDCLYSYRVHWETVTKKSPTRRQELLRKAFVKTLERRGIPRDAAELPKVSSPKEISNKDRDNDLVSHFMVSVVDQRHAARHAAALADAVNCLKLHPLDPYYYKPLLYAVAPLGLVDWYRARSNK